MNFRTLPYYGGKRGYGKAAWIASLLPWDRWSTYIEPFAGMGAVLLARQPVRVEILNDLNSRVVNWWRAVRDHPAEFAYLVENTPNSRQEYAWAMGAVDDQSISLVKRALAFHILVDQSVYHADGHLYLGNWSAAYTPQKCLIRWGRDGIERLAERLALVYLESRDAVAILHRVKASADAVIYCDPPYPTAQTQHYAVDDLDLPAMRDLLLAQAGAVAISGYGAEWDCLGWEKSTRQALRWQIGRVNCDPRTETLWRNAKCVELASVQRLL